MGSKNALRRRILTPVCLAMLASTGCSYSQTAPAFTPAQQEEIRKQEVSAEMQTLIDMESKYGSDHSQVRQMKMELGLDPDKPAAEQSP